jgi:Undecaprenyl-phosphate glucose phosphotransferase
MLFRLRLYRLLLTVTVYLLPFPAFEIGWALWAFSWKHIDRPALYSHQGQLVLILISCFVWALISEHYRLTSVDELYRERTGTRGPISACIVTGAVLLGALYFTRNSIFPRGLFVCCMVALLFCTLLLRAVFRDLFRRRFHIGRATSIVIVGADQFAKNTADRLQLVPFARCEIVAYIRLPGQQVAVEGCPVYELDQIEMVNGGQGIEEVVIAVHPGEFPIVPKLLTALEKLCVPVRTVVDLGEGVVVRERLFQLGSIQMLDLTTTPVDSVVYALLKRSFDISFSLLILVAASPLLLLIAILIRLTSSGAALFGQERIGLNGKSFHMYKFRTMQIADVAESDVRWTTAKDPRRTRLGCFLRRWSLDELPQFFNVLKGEMSVVGPRPERPYFVDKFLQEVARYNHRHCLKVGITGWAQVNGWRGDTRIDKRLEYDLYYLQNWSFGFDLRIIAMTVLSEMISRRGY